MSKADQKTFQTDTEDGNYIKKDHQDSKAENKTENKSENKSANSIFDEIINELKETKEKLESAIRKVRPKRKQERELDKETGGTEIDYKKEAEMADEDVDIWDKEAKEEKAAEVLMDGDDFESSANQSFIHRKKRNKGKRKGKLGPMTLDDNDNTKKFKPKTMKTKDGKTIEIPDKKESMVDKIKRFRLDRENDPNMGQGL